ncbi:MAG TPA: ParB/RepB/Spo0J family partition protein [Candidatus Acidoferrum sp.]|nr:ParB/RepB/Spo0J family partition protein [Candidatus Acidoferrum sp.]
MESLSQHFKDSLIREIDIQQILPTLIRLRPLDEQTIGELMESVRLNGLLQPITVRPVDEKQFRLVFGCHRLEAITRLGWKKVPAIVREISDEESFLMNVTENLQRNAYVSPIAEARGYKHLISKGWTIGEIAKRIGKSESYVCNRMRVLERLHPELRKQVEFPRGNSHLTLSHMEQLSTVREPSRQLELARLVHERNLSLHQLERLTRKTGKKMVRTKCLCAQCEKQECSLRREPIYEQCEANKQLVKRFLEAINSRDFDAFDKLCTRDHVWHIYVWHTYSSTIAHTDMYGLESFKKAVAEWHLSNPDLELLVGDMIAERNRVAVRYTWKGPDSDNKILARSSISIYAIEDGKIAEEWLLDDEFRQLNDL